MAPSTQVSSLPLDLDSRYSSLLNPIRDLNKNWEVNIVVLLEDFLAEFEYLMSLSNGMTSLDFIRAALVIQGSTTVYCKKVEYLFSLCEQMRHDLIERKRKRFESETPEEKGTNDQCASDEFSSLDDFKEGRRLFCTDDVNDNDQSKRRSILPLTPIVLIPLDDREKGDDILLNASGNFVGHRRDYHLNICHFGNSGALLLPMSSSEMVQEFINHEACTPLCNSESIPLSMPCSKETQEIPTEETTEYSLPAVEALADILTVDDCIDSPEMQEIPSEKTCDCSLPDITAEMGISDAIGDCVGSPEEMAEIPTEESHGCSFPALEAQANTGAVDIIGSRAPSPCFSELSICRSSVLEVTHSNRRRSARLACKAQDKKDEMSVMQEPCTYNLQKIPSKKRKTRKSIANFRNRRGGRNVNNVASENCTVLPSIPSVECCSNAGSPAGNLNDDLYNDILPENVYEALEESPYAQSTEQEIPGVSTDEEFANQNVEIYLQSLAHYCIPTDLSKKIDEWEKRLRPILKNERRREVFDIDRCEDKIMGSFLINKRKQSIPFSNICKGKEKWEVCRYFLAALQLANSCNLNITETVEEGNGDFELTLLSPKTHFEHMQEVTGNSFEINEHQM